MNKRGIARFALWVLVIVSPMLSYALIGFATDTSLLSIDAWCSPWNDESRHYRTVMQMREFGAPSGVAGYDEVPALRPSYGPYCDLTYAPYLLASFFTGVSSNNFMYVINSAFGVVISILLVVVLRPGVRQSVLLAMLFLFQFPITRHLCSGMVEGSYVLYGAILVGAALYAVKRSERPELRGSTAREPWRQGALARDVASGQVGGLGTGNGEGAAKSALWPTLAALIVMIAATGLWGGMRPYVLAFMLVPWLLVAFCGFGFKKQTRIAVALAGVVAALAALGYYMYASKYYATPYISSTTFAEGFIGMIADELPNLAIDHLKGLKYVVVKSLELNWHGIMPMLFALAWVVLLAMFLRVRKRGDGARSGLYLGLLLAGLAVFEANMLLYSYVQMYRTMMVVIAVYSLVIAFHWDVLKVDRLRISFGSAFIVAMCALCICSLIGRPGDYAYPQTWEKTDPTYVAATRSELEELMPRSDDSWDNTVAHLVENGNMHLYYALPAYMNTNNLQDEYVERCIEENSFKSKYVAIPEKNRFNKLMRAHYRIVYKGDAHVIYKVRD